MNRPVLAPQFSRACRSSSPSRVFNRPFSHLQLFVGLVVLCGVLFSIYYLSYNFINIFFSSKNMCVLFFYWALLVSLQLCPRVSK